MRHLHWFAFYIAVICLSAWLPVRAQSLPDGRGKADFLRICGTCHKVDIVVQKRMDKYGWSGVVDDMVGRGAQGTDDQFDRIVRYLATNFGPDKPLTKSSATPAPKVDMNSANAGTLVSDLGLSTADADAIVQYREKNGKFKSLADVEKVAGVDLKVLESNKDRMEF